MVFPSGQRAENKLNVGNIIGRETTTKQTQSARTKSFYFAKNITLKFSVYQL